MVKTECKWPTSLKKWRVVVRDNGTVEGQYQPQAYIGWWFFGEWQNIGSSTQEVANAIEWIEKQCKPSLKHKEEVVWP